MALRSTFRKISAPDDPCYQRQCRDRYVDEPTPPVPHLDVGRARVEPIDRRLAEQVILKYEWLGTMAYTNAHFGIFFGPFLAGVTCVSVGSGTAGIYAHRKYGIRRKDLATLCRGANVHWSPTGANSKLIAWTAKFLRGKARVLVAYSDRDAGEIGTVYQASNWFLVGRTTGPDQWVSPDGKSVRNYNYPYSIAKTRGRSGLYWKDRLLADGWKLQPVSRKLIYAYPVDRSLRRRLAAMSLPFPKRTDSAAEASRDALGLPAERERFDSDSVAS
jgi:hypothetical protein